MNLPNDQEIRVSTLVALPRLHEEIGFSVILPLATITIVIIFIVIVLNRPQEVAER